MPPRETVRIMTFNLLYETAPHPAGDWSVRRRLAVDLVQRWAPDVVGVQEATATQCRHLAQDLPEYRLEPGPASGESRLPLWAATVSPALAGVCIAAYRRYRTGGKPLWRAVAVGLAAISTLPVAGTAGSYLACRGTVDHGEYCAILYRKDTWRQLDNEAFWISNQPHRPGSVLLGSWLPRVVQRVRLEHLPTATAFDIYNTHVDYLPWSTGRSGSTLRSYLDCQWTESRSQVLMGDMNASPGSALYSNLTAPASNGVPPLRDAWATSASQGGPVGTFHNGAGRIKWGGRIDHILARTPWRAVRVTTVTDSEAGRYPSDHFPVVAEYAKL